MTNCINKVKLLKPTKLIYGFIAHELEEVLPQAVTGEKDAEEMLQVDYSKIDPLLVNSIQEQQTTIEDLKKSIETLEK